MVDNSKAKINVELAYANDTCSFECVLRVAPATTIIEVIRQSGVLQEHPEIDLSTYGFGIFGEVAQANTPVAEGARVEIYKPLTCSPTEARRRNAERQ